jgi:SAM-dependent methyltransferase
MNSQENFNYYYSKYYDFFYKRKNYNKEIKILRKFIKSDSEKILEFGCGTGNYTKNLSRVFNKVVAIDKSRHMINIAKKKFSYLKNIFFVCSDINSLNKKKLFKESDFSFVTALFHILSYQNKHRDINIFFKRASENMKVGGYFMFDFWFKDGVCNIRPEKRIKKINNKNYLIYRIVNSELLRKINIVRSVYDVIVFNKKKKISHIFHESHFMRYFSIKEIKSFLKKYRLKLIFIKDSYKFERPTKKHWSLLAVAKKY